MDGVEVPPPVPDYDGYDVPVSDIPCQHRTAFRVGAEAATKFVTAPDLFID